MAKRRSSKTSRRDSVALRRNATKWRIAGLCGAARVLLGPHRRGDIELLLTKEETAELQEIYHRLESMLENW